MLDFHFIWFFFQRIIFIYSLYFKFTFSFHKFLFCLCLRSSTKCSERQKADFFIDFLWFSSHDFWRDMNVNRAYHGGYSMNEQAYSNIMYMLYISITSFSELILWQQNIQPKIINWTFLYYSIFSFILVMQYFKFVTSGVYSFRNTIYDFATSFKGAKQPSADIWYKEP